MFDSGFECGVEAVEAVPIRCDSLTKSVRACVTRAMLHTGAMYSRTKPSALFAPMCDTAEAGRLGMGLVRTC